MIKIYIENFATSHFSESWRDVMENISDYCHVVSTDVEIYNYYQYNYMHCGYESLTFPNVVYIENLYISYKVVNLSSIFPDLTKVGLFSNSTNKVSFGKIKEIDILDCYFLTMPRKSLGDNRYRFTNKETGEQWNIKVDNFLF